MRSDIVDIDVQIHATTERGVLVSDDGDIGTAVWLPLSQIEAETTRDGKALVSLPAWLAIDKGLL